jgi:hypothetical protein
MLAVAMPHIPLLPVNANFDGGLFGLVCDDFSGACFAFRVMRCIACRDTAWRKWLVPEADNLTDCPATGRGIYPLLCCGASPGYYDLMKFAGKD